MNRDRLDLRITPVHADLVIAALAVVFLVAVAAGWI